MRPIISRIAFATAALVAVVGAAPPHSGAQVASSERYYDFWPGVWYHVKDGVRDSVATFTVRRSVHRAAFEEDWRLIVDSGRVSRSLGIRAWDEATGKWMLVWVSDRGHFQIWDGVRIGSDWYVQRPFEQGGRRFLSRQAWIPDGPNRVLRIMERSFDDGQTWETRSRATYERGR